MLSATTIDLGTTLDSSTVTLTNRGEAVADWTSSVGPAGFTSSPARVGVSPTSGSLGGGQSVVLTVSADRAGMSEGPQPSTQIILGSSESAASVRVLVERAEPPIVRVARSPGPRECFRANNGLGWEIVASDESPPMTIVGRLALTSGSLALAFGGSSGSWNAMLSPSALDLDGDGAPDQRSYSWSVTVTDRYGNATPVDGSFGVDPTC